MLHSINQQLANNYLLNIYKQNNNSCNIFSNNYNNTAIKLNK